MPSMEELLADIKRNQGDAIALFDPTGQHIKDVVWPFMEAFVESVRDELRDVAEKIIEIEDGEAELLHEETADQILGALELGAVFAVALQKSIGQNPNEAGKKLLAKIVEYSALTKILVPHVESITLEEGDEDPDAVDGEVEEPDAAEGGA